MRSSQLGKIENLARSLDLERVQVSSIEVTLQKPRTLALPNQYARENQKALLELLSKTKFPCFVFSQRGYSFLDKVKYHLKDEYLVNLDISNFFNSIHYSRIERILRELGVSEGSSKILRQLTTFNYSLPLGFATSPIVSNLVISELDQDLFSYAQSRGFRYSRYVDDISFSGECDPSRYVKKFTQIVRQHQLRINDKKTELYKPGEARFVLGIKIYRGSLDVTDKYLDKVREHAELLKLGQKYSLDQEDLVKTIVGELRFIKQINQTSYEGLLSQCPILAPLKMSGDRRVPK